MFKKYFHYLTIKHDWNGLNCFTLIQDIYKYNLEIDFKSSFIRLKTEYGKTTYSRKWFLNNFTKEFFDKETSHWTKINLTDLKEYDILVFIDGKSRPNHFGCYIAENKFIHLEEGQYTRIDLLNQEWRNDLAGAYRNNELVR